MPASGASPMAIREVESPLAVRVETTEWETRGRLRKVGRAEVEERKRDLVEEASEKASVDVVVLRWEVRDISGASVKGKRRVAFVESKLLNFVSYLPYL